MKDSSDQLLTSKGVRSLAKELHVAPLEDGHEPTSFCWCQPVVHYEDPVTGGLVFSHNDIVN